VLLLLVPLLLLLLIVSEARFLSCPSMLYRLWRLWLWLLLLLPPPPLLLLWHLLHNILSIAE
jgi:hypothetical protein